MLGLHCDSQAQEYVGSVVEAHGLISSMACGILVPQPGIEPTSPVSEVRFLTPGLSGKSLLFLIICYSYAHKHLCYRMCMCVCVCVCAKSLQLCLTLCDPVDYSPPGSSVHGILQARILERVFISFSRGSSRARD